MFPQPLTGAPQKTDQYTVSSVNNQSNGLIGNPQLSGQQNTPFLNDTQIQPQVAMMIKALQGGGGSQ